MMKVAMNENVPVNEGPQHFIGSMKGTMKIVGDIVAPVDVMWSAEAEESKIAISD